MKFSERKGYKIPSQTIQIEGMNDELRNSIWSSLDLFIWRRSHFMYSLNIYTLAEIVNFSQALWFGYFKKPIDEISKYPENILQFIREYFFKCEWYEVYDFLEFVLKYFKEHNLDLRVNEILERELSGYRFVENVLTDITNEQEIALLEDALENNDFPGVRNHLKRALELLSDRKSPDFRNSIKESISAVESIVQTITGKTKVTLDDALKELEKKEKIHSALKNGFSNLYGYTSDQDGIRHAMLQEPDLTVSDAKYFLLSCTSFINYLKSKI